MENMDNNNHLTNGNDDQAESANKEGTVHGVHHSDHHGDHHSSHRGDHHSSHHGDHHISHHGDHHSSHHGDHHSSHHGDHHSSHHGDHHSGHHGDHHSGHHGGHHGSSHSGRSQHHSKNKKINWVKKPTVAFIAALLTVLIIFTVVFEMMSHKIAESNQKILELEQDAEQRLSEIEKLRKGITVPADIREWDTPIYDANIPVFELSTEKLEMTNAACTPDDIYARYDALMAKYPDYITKTDLGLCSDGINHVYRYDFRASEPHHESNKDWSEIKTKAIIVTGIHYEWAGIYAMYNALEEIAGNPELRDLRRNVHLIVVPVANPYATIAENYQNGLSTPNSQGIRNANGVEIHRNFEAEWELTEEGSKHYGGPAPLSEVETQYLDKILKENTDAAFFLTCHNCEPETTWGTGFIWASTATKYMCNLSYRLIDKMSFAWMDRYGDVLSQGIEEYKTDLLEDGDTRLGWAGLSTTIGTETKQAAKYGIQAANVEICVPFRIHGTTDNPESSLSSFTMSRGTEVYVNFLLTALGVYDPSDKSLYSGNQTP